VRDSKPAVRNRMRIEPIESDTRTLGDHYRQKLARYRHYRRGMADELLRKIFSAERAMHSMRACTLLRTIKPSVIGAVAAEAGVERYTVLQIHKMVVERSERLKLHVRGSRRDALRHSRWMLLRLTRMYGQGETPHLAL
jgi:hypothetical protein